jgi:hypothetical protein
MTDIRDFSLTCGGPFYRALRRLHLVKGRDMIRGFTIALLAWLPMITVDLVRAVVGARAGPTLLDLSAHVRVLVAMPLLLMSERLVDVAVWGAVASLYDRDIADRAVLDPIVARVKRARDSWWCEGALFALAITGGQLALWRVSGATGLAHGGVEAFEWSFPRIWYAVVALPLVQFVMFRWLWRWLLWSYMLVCFARLPLRTLATHPDQAAGLSALAWPVTTFGGFAVASGTVLSAAWATQLFAGRTTLAALLPAMLAFLVILVAVATAPLLLFCGHLYRARRLALFQYGDLAHAYVRQFQTKWIERPGGTVAPLGSPDIQSLNDLGGAFRVVESTRLFVFGPRKIFDVCLAALLPMVPLFASEVTVEQVLKKIVFTVGGVPL